MNPQRWEATLRELNHPIIGVRAWHLFPRNERSALEKYSYPADESQAGLYSTYAQTQWFPGINTARCVDVLDHLTYHPCSDPPGAICDCGLYAYHNLDLCDAHWAHHFIGTFGIVRGWGKVHLHPEGWRAQYAEVLALIGQIGESQMPISFWRPPIIKRLAKEFGVPVLPFTAVNAMMTEFGDTVPQDMWPTPGDDIDPETPVRK